MRDHDYLSAAAQQDRDERAAERIARIQCGQALAARIGALDLTESHWVLYRLTTDSHADVEVALDALEQRKRAGPLT